VEAKEKKMVRITICIEPETERLIRLLSRRHGRSISELVREAVEAHWVKTEKVVEGDDPLRSVDPKAATLLDLATVPGTVFLGATESVDPAQDQET
jgi:hypothetical protein